MVWSKGQTPGGGGGGSGDFVGPGSSVDSNFVQFDGITGKLGKDGGLSLDTDVNLAADSDLKIPSQKAVKAYADAIGSTPPGGATTNIQFNNTGNFDGVNGFTFDSGSLAMAIGETGTATGKINFIGNISGMLTMYPPSAITTYDLVLPGDPGTAGYVLSTDGNGITSWIANGSGANTSLSNLAAVAINTALIPATAGALDIGSSAKPWADLWLAGSSGTPATNKFRITGASTGGTRTVTLQDASGTVAYLADIPAATTPAGSTTQVQFNNAGAFGADAGFTFATGTNTLTLGEAASATGKLAFKGTTSGTVTLSVADAAGTWTMKLPATTGTNGQALTTDGSGNTTWSTISGGGGGQKSTAEGRLTLTSNTPVLTSSVTAATTIYYTPFIGNGLALYNGATWDVIGFSETSLALTGLAADTNFDIFGYNNAGALALEALAWTNDTTRATALVRQDGVWSKTGALTRRYLGTIRTTGTTGQTEFSFGGQASGGSAAKLFVWNANNQVDVNATIQDSDTSWTYSTATWRGVRGQDTMRASFVVGLSVDAFAFTYWAEGNNGTAGFNIANAIGYDTTSTPTFGTGAFNSSTANIPMPCQYSTTPTPGFHYCQALEYADGGVVGTWFGDAGTTYAQTGSTFKFKM